MFNLHQLNKLANGSHQNPLQEDGLSEINAQAGLHIIKPESDVVANDLSTEQVLRFELNKVAGIMGDCKLKINIDNAHATNTVTIYGSRLINKIQYEDCEGNLLPVQQQDDNNLKARMGETYEDSVRNVNMGNLSGYGSNYGALTIGAFSNQDIYIPIKTPFEGLDMSDSSVIMEVYLKDNNVGGLGIFTAGTCSLVCSNPRLSPSEERKYKENRMNKCIQHKYVDFHRVAHDSITLASSSEHSIALDKVTNESAGLFCFLRNNDISLGANADSHLDCTVGLEDANGNTVGKALSSDLAKLNAERMPGYYFQHAHRCSVIPFSVHLPSLLSGVTTGTVPPRALKDYNIKVINESGSIGAHRVSVFSATPRKVYQLNGKVYVNKPGY